MKDPEPATVDSDGAPQVRVTGYLIVFTVLGASIGRRIAQVDPIDNLKGWARRAAESETLDNLLTYVLIGATFGFAIGFIGERWLPKWSNKFWVYAIIATSLLFAFRLAMLPWAMP